MTADLVHISISGGANVTLAGKLFNMPCELKEGLTTTARGCERCKD